VEEDQPWHAKSSECAVDNCGWEEGQGKLWKKHAVLYTWEESNKYTHDDGGDESMKKRCI
jgi:hypothetical protein